MSQAREALDAFVKRYGPDAGHSVAFAHLVDKLITETRAQTLRGASQRIHGSIPTGQRIDGGSYWQGVDYAARLIDPDDGYSD